MSNAEQISHLCTMIRGNTYHSYLSCLDADYGYLDRLNKVADKGGFATDGTLEILSLRQAEDDLMKLAAEIGNCRIRLINNYSQRNAA